MTGESQTTEKGNKFAKDVMWHMNKKCAAWKKETNLGFSLYGTPEICGHRNREVSKKILN